MTLIEEGGIGTIRLRPRKIDGEDSWLATAVTGRQCAGGVPLAVPDVLIRQAKIAWGDRVRLHGQVRFLHDAGLEDPAHHVHHARPLLIFVEEIEALRAKKLPPILITPVVLFGDAHANRERSKSHNRWSNQLGYTFVQCPAGSDEELDRAATWVGKYATKHGGQVITNYDEHRPMLSDAPLSYQRLVKKTFDRTVIEHLHMNGGKLADQIYNLVQEEVMSVNVTLGDGTIVYGDLVVANSIRDSFNRVKESPANDKLKTAAQQLTSEVGKIITLLDPENAKKAADDLETLTREVARAKPRREWWELSLKGLKDAAVAVKEIGQPVIATVKMLTPLLAAVSA
jgi:hypothetical protein